MEPLLVISFVGVHPAIVSCSLLLICLFLCSTYDIQFLLDALANSLCPIYFPPGQECTLPLYPGEYGSLVGGPMEFELGDINETLGKQIFIPKKFCLKLFSNLLYTK